MDTSLPPPFFPPLLRPTGHAACSGCGLCQLVCPVWRGTGPFARDVEMTPHGRAKAVQHGASAAELVVSAATCSLCGACEVVCPEHLPIIALTRQLIADAGVRVPEASAYARACADTTAAPLALHEFAALAAALRPDDLYVIEPRPYHHDYERNVLLYTKLLADAGCMSNLDLQRVAIPADDAGQARWILSGRAPARIIVERERDRAVFAGLGDWPVVHVSEILPPRRVGHAQR